MYVPRPQDAALPVPAPDTLAGAYALLGLDVAADDALVELSVRHHVEAFARMSLDGPARRARLDRLDQARRRIAGARPAGTPATDAAVAGDPYRTLRVHPAADQHLITAAYRHLLAQAAAAGDDAAFELLECAYARIGTPAARALYHRQTATSPPVSAATDGLVAVWRRIAKCGPRLAGAGLRIGRALKPRARSSDDDMLAGDRGAGAPPPQPAAIRNPHSAIDRQVAHPVAALRVTESGSEVLTLPLRDRTAYTIGSGPQAAVRLPRVAAVYARLTAGQGWVHFEQLADGAVSLVNGTRSVRALLGPGDRLEIGSYRCQYVIVRYEPRG